MLLHRIFLRLRYAASGLPLAGVALLLTGEWRWGAGALAGGAVLYPLFDVLERRCRPRARYETDERGHARPKYK